jgi:phosphohistidine phosphatase
VKVRLHLLRHADAGDRASWSGPDDERPLSDEGRAQADRLGAFLRASGFEPDVILSSPLARARETADLVASHLGRPVVISEPLASGPTVAALEALLAEVGDPRTPLLVGHDPAFSELGARLLDLRGLALRKGALLRVDADRPLAPGGGRLRALVPPDLLPPPPQPTADRPVRKPGRSAASRSRRASPEAGR